MSETHDISAESQAAPPEAIESRSAGSETEDSVLAAGSDVATQLPEATIPEIAREVDATPALPSRPRESPVDSRVAALRALFPDFDDALLCDNMQLVLSCHLLSLANLSSNLWEEARTKPLMCS